MISTAMSETSLMASELTEAGGSTAEPKDSPSSVSGARVVIPSNWSAVPISDIGMYRPAIGSSMDKLGLIDALCFVTVDEKCTVVFGTSVVRDSRVVGIETTVAGVIVNGGGDTGVGVPVFGL